MGKTSNIIRWVVFGLLALVTVALAVWYYLGINGEGLDLRVNTVLNWSYINLILGVALFVISFIIVLAISVKKGVPTIKAVSLGVTVAFFVILAVVAFFVSKDKIDSALNFFYLIFGVSLIVILASAVYNLLNKRA